MRFLADENCDRLMVSALRSAGHDVSYVVEWGAGQSDPEIFARAQAEKRVLLTNDQGFGLLAENASEQPPAIVLLRLDPLLAPARTKRVLEGLPVIKGMPPGRLVVVEPGSIRDRAFKNR
jgi:predicted nuclease of predicted toxin-antitoxin system